jgi:nicotinamidase-related amidase
MKTQLLIIDPQVDFCHPQGALYVKGAEEDCLRLSKFLDRTIDMIDDIRVTLDSHQPVHIAHPICWIDAKGNHPAPFTLISLEDVEGKNPKWKAFNPAWQTRQVEYVRALKAGNRYVLCIWPPHCLISTVGHTVEPSVGTALRKWQDQFAMIDFVTKGSNPFTEHYSVVKADVPDPEDQIGTGLNVNFIRRLQEADQILVAGQALSHCVANSVRDIAAEFGEEHIKKIVLLEDASSPVPGFETLADDFVKEMVGRGMQLAKTTDF